MAGGSASQIFQGALLGPFLTRRKSKKFKVLSSQPNQKDLVYLKQLIEAGIIKPVVDRSYQLSEVPEAIGYLYAGHARGKAVIKVRTSATPVG